MLKSYNNNMEEMDFWIYNVKIDQKIYRWI